MSGDGDMLALVIRAITDVAPDVDPETVSGADSLSVDLELDSMDFLAVVQRLAEATGCAIPEEDYAELTTVAATASYLARSTPAH